MATRLGPGTGVTAIQRASAAAAPANPAVDQRHNARLVQKLLATGFAVLVLICASMACQVPVGGSAEIARLDSGWSRLSQKTTARRNSALTARAPATSSASCASRRPSTIRRRVRGAPRSYRESLVETPSQRVQSSPDPALNTAERRLDMRGDFRVGQAVHKGQYNTTLLLRVEQFETATQRVRFHRGPNLVDHIRFDCLVAEPGIVRRDLPACFANCVERAKADDAREPCCACTSPAREGCGTLNRTGVGR